MRARHRRRELDQRDDLLAGSPPRLRRLGATRRPGLGWDDMLAAYKAVEDHELGANEFRGSGGPLGWRCGPFRYSLAEAMIEAGAQARLATARRPQPSRSRPASATRPHHPARAPRELGHGVPRPGSQANNLVVRTGVLVERVVFEEGGPWAWWNGRRQAKDLRGSPEVASPAGSVMSPELLELSGIGDGDRLQRLGIPVVHRSPLVGERMRDHLTFSMPHRLIGAKGDGCFRGVGRVPWSRPTQWRGRVR